MKENRTERISFRCTEEVKAAARAVADRTGHTVSTVLYFAVAEKLLGKRAPFEHLAAGAGQ